MNPLVALDAKLMEACEAAIQELNRLLQHQDPKVRQEAALAILKLAGVG